jgi:sorting nexin-29
MKGDRISCHNYRPITLLNTVYKIFAILLNNRLTDTIENKLEDCQMGSRPNRSTIDNIFPLKQIFEKCYEYNIDLCIMFIDYIQAFDSVCRNKIIDCLSQSQRHRSLFVKYLVVIIRPLGEPLRILSNSLFTYHSVI